MGNDDRALSPLFDLTDQRTVGQDKNVYHASLLVALIPLNIVLFFIIAASAPSSVTPNGGDSSSTRAASKEQQQQQAATTLQEDEDGVGGKEPPGDGDKVSSEQGHKLNRDSAFRSLFPGGCANCASSPSPGFELMPSGFPPPRFPRSRN